MPDDSSSEKLSADNAQVSGIGESKKIAVGHSDVFADATLEFRDRIDPKLERQFRATAFSAEVLVLCVAIIEIIGWALGIDAIKHPVDEPALRSAAAINFAALSSAILMRCVGSPRLWRLSLARAFALLVIIAGTATYVEHTFHLYWDDLVIWQAADSRGLTYPGPLLPHESLAFALLGLGVLFLKAHWKRSDWITQLLGLLVLVPNFIILCFYMLGQSHLCVYFGCVKLSPISCSVFSIASYGLFFAIPNVGLARAFSFKGTAGMLIRRAATGVGIIILLLMPHHWLITSGTVDETTANIGTALVSFLALIAFAWWCLPQVETEEKKKQQAIEDREQVIEQKEQEIQLLQSGAAGSALELKLVCLECAKEFTGTTLTNCPDDDAMLVRIMDKLRPGALFGERYRIVKELGSGGMSTVYLARHELMNKEVAIKVLQMQYSSNPKMIQRFQREARATSSLSHPNLVAVHDFSVTSDGQAFMVMELVAGSDLSEFISSNGPMPWRQAVQLFLQICEGINYAHANGVIHRDLKPSNVMLPAEKDEQGFLAKIVDFGFAKRSDELGQHLTRTGDVFGTPLFMSPEQCKGIPMDRRSDLYALGCIMYYCLTAEPPFTGRNVMETLSMHLDEPLPPVPVNCGVPTWLEKIVHKLMAKDPAERYQTAVEVIVALNVGLSLAESPAT